MKWLAFIFLLLILPITGAEPNCKVSELQGNVMQLNMPTERLNMMLSWLKINGPYCSKEKLLYIQNQRALWLGTADSAKAQSLINYYLEK